MAGGFGFAPPGFGDFQPAPQTPFQASLAPCSFRGVGFIVEEFGGGVGRRGELHEYPLRDIPDAEDLGRRARRWRWRCYVLGDNALLQWQALCSALEQPGSGILALPDGSQVLAQVDPRQEQRYTLVLDKQRKVSFELAFVEAGQTLYPGSTLDTQAASGTAANNLDNAADQDFGGGADQVGTPAGQVTIKNIDIASASTPIINDPGIQQP